MYEVTTNLSIMVFVQTVKIRILAHVLAQRTELQEKVLITRSLWRLDHQISVETELLMVSEESLLETELDLGLTVSQALRLSSAWVRMSHQTTLSFLESAESKCLSTVVFPCLITTRLSLSSLVAGLLVSSMKVCILEQISLGHRVTALVTDCPRSNRPIGS